MSVRVMPVGGDINATVQKWEYLTLTVALCHENDGGVIKLINGKEISDWKRSNLRLPDALVRYGNEGWELTGLVWRVYAGTVGMMVTGGAGAWDSLFVFKRPKSPGDR